MKLQFDAKQPYQIDAVNAVVDLFDGQPLNKPDYATILQTFDTELFGSVGQTDLGIGNKLIIDRETLLKNLQRVQERNDLDVDEPQSVDSTEKAQEAILKHDDTVLYLGREPQPTRRPPERATRLRDPVAKGPEQF